MLILASKMGYFMEIFQEISDINELLDAGTLERRGSDLALLARPEMKNLALWKMNLERSVGLVDNGPHGRSTSES